jgi:DNA transformation protein
MPERLYDDPDELATWARAALAAAHRTGVRAVKKGASRRAAGKSAAGNKSAAGKKRATKRSAKK